MGAGKLHVRRSEITPTIVAVAIIVLLGLAALLGGDLVIHKQQSALTLASDDVTNSAGRASFPVGDGSTCRELTFDRMNGDILSSTTHPCKEPDPNIVVRRKFIWGK